jgi:prepilin-type N-terminal cleavage/methylation domain-containing protein
MLFLHRLVANMKIRTPQRPGFTLIELLTVISIITILASMLLPSLSSAKERAKVTKSLSNFHQIGLAIEMYKHDTKDGRFPTAFIEEAGGVLKRSFYTLGGRNPLEPFRPFYPLAASRPLYPYLGLSEVFRCTSDRGQRNQPFPEGSHRQKPSNWETIGSSYHYNVGELPLIQGGGFRFGFAGPLGGRPENWVPDPSRYILMHEPSARMYAAGGIPEWYQWHYARQASDISDVTAAPRSFISPTLYVDSHAEVNNFSKSLQTNPRFPYEETKNWIWYKPLRTPSAY